MNHRNPLAGIALSALMLTASLPMTGCTVTDAQIRADANAVATAMENIAVVLKNDNPEYADKLAMAGASLRAAAANYKTGSSEALLNTAASIAEITLSQIPQTSEYAPLVAIAVAAVEVLLANLPQSNAVKAMAVPRQPNPYHGQAIIKHRALRSPEGDFKAAWNEAALRIGAAKL